MALGLEAILALVVGLVGGGTTVLGLVDKRRRDISQIWKDLAEAEAAKAAAAEASALAAAERQSARIATLEAKVEVLESDFVHRIVAEVVTEVTAAIDRSRP